MTKHIKELIEAEFEGVNIIITHNLAMLPDKFKIRASYLGFVCTDYIFSIKAANHPLNDDWFREFYIPRLQIRIAKWVAAHVIDEIDMQEVI